jgi:hypothetical protein
MKKIISLILIFAAFIFTSCEDPIQIKLDEGSKLVVIDAFVNDLRQDQIIRVTQNDSYFSGKKAPPITNALVLLEDLTEAVTYTFTYANGNYIYPIGVNDTIAKLNHQYKLHVTVNGIEYTSTTILKRTAAIDSIQSIYNEGNGGFGNQTPFYLAYLWAKDKVDFSPDYYWVRTFRNDTLFGEAGELNLAIDGTNGSINPEEANNLDSLTFTPPSTFLGFKQYKKFDKVKVEIHSVARETYNFLLQAAAQIQNGGLFATTPENVKTNIITPKDQTVKGVGWFEVSKVEVKERIIF